jgi:peptide/nickel transport system substrate-binding protein
MNPIGDDVVMMERNPYFYKVDPEGNQLPYIDRIEVRLVLDREGIPLSAMSGEIDFQLRHIAFTNYPLLMENRDKGNYDVYRWPYSLGSAYAYMPNLNVKDPKKNALFNDRRFRIALSHAIDREEINEISFLGVCKPRHATVVPECEFYAPDLEEMYATLDPQKSRQLLEEIGLKKGADGYYDYADGSDLAITITTIPLETYGKWADMAELVGGYWDRIGIKNEVQVIDRSLYTTRYQAGDFDIGGWAWGRGLAPLIAPKFVFPSDNTYNPAPLWGRWYQTGGAEGLEPPADHPVRKAMEMYGRYTSEPDPAKRLQIGKDLIRLSAEECWSIGTVGMVPDPVVVSRRLGNVPENLLSEHLLSSPNNAGVIQFYFK